MGSRLNLGTREKMSMKRRFLKAGGFTLIEVLLVVFILGVVCITLISIFAYGINLLAKTTQTNAATQVAQFEIERYRNMRFADITPLAGSPVTFDTLFNNDETSPYFFLYKKDGAGYVPVLRNGRETITIEDGAALNMDEDIKKMTVRVEWDFHTRTIDSGDPMRKDVVTYFSSSGINRR
jgi:prepilin-type N-terminal cleavage/methylation domain-containing protein